jgi:lysozyme
MKTSADGIAIIKSFESCKTDAYKCPAGIWTIGYGHTGADVHAGQKITPDDAKQLLLADLSRFETAIANCVHVPLEQHEFDACISLAFNIGAGAFGDSTLVKLLNRNDKAGAAEQFPRWNRGGSVVLPGLVRRRAAERLLFLNDQTWRGML